MKRKTYAIEWKVTWTENGVAKQRSFRSFARLRTETLRINRCGGKEIQVQVTKVAATAVGAIPTR